MRPPSHKPVAIRGTEKSANRMTYKLSIRNVIESTSIFASLVYRPKLLKIPLTLGSSFAEKLRCLRRWQRFVLRRDEMVATLCARAPECRLWPGALLLAALVQLAGCAGKTEAAPPPPPEVQVVSIEQKDVPVY